MTGITLIGMPASGKSIIGRALAKRLNFKFIDLDDLILEKEGRSHAEILAESGKDKLLEIEEKYTLGLDLHNTVFSPGGSIIYSETAMKKLQNETLIFYLELPLEKLKERLSNKVASRGIVGLEGKGIAGLFKERAPIYQKFAHHTINCTNLKDEDCIDEILQHKKS